MQTKTIMAMGIMIPVISLSSSMITSIHWIIQPDLPQTRQVIDNGATTETTITHDVDIPNTSVLPMQFPTTTNDKVDDTDTRLVKDHA
jgi:hypothetical protein